MIEKYGADSIRLFILSDSPPEKDIQWSDQGMMASYKFVQKLWGLHCKIKSILDDGKNFSNPEAEEKITKFTHQLIQKITNNLERFNYNVIVANLYEMYNFFNKILSIKMNKEIIKENFSHILKLISPLMPHLAAESLEQLKIENKNEWPKPIEKYLKNENLEMIVQINGKKE